MLSISKPIITREHGSWAVLFIPMLIGVGYAETFSWNFFFLAVSSLGVFMSYVPIQTLLRKIFNEPVNKAKQDAAVFWAAIYLSIGIIFSLPLLFNELWVVILFALAGMLTLVVNSLLTRTVQKSITSDLVSVAGLTISAPCAYYVLTERVDSISFVVWILNFLFFGSSVFYVHMKIRASSLKKEKLNFVEKLSLGWLNILYHCVMVFTIAALALYKFTSTFTILAFIPIIVHAIAGTIRLQTRMKFKTLGFLLLLQSISFALSLILFLR